jgi:hypothetical protein
MELAPSTPDFLTLSSISWLPPEFGKVNGRPSFMAIANGSFGLAFCV